MRIVFSSWGKEALEINSGRKKSITRKVDWCNPAFEKIEQVNLRMSLVKERPNNLWGSLGNIINIRGEGDFVGRIKKVDYKDGDVTVYW